MLRNVKEFSALGPRQQGKRIKQFITSQTNTQTIQTIMNRPTMSSPSIIRIVPASTKKTTPVKRKANAFVINRAKTAKVETVAPSTNRLHVQSTSHIEDHKYESLEVPDFEEYTLISNDNVAYVEQVEADSPKQVFIPVQKAKESFSTVPEKVNKVHSSQCCCSCRETLDILLKQQQEILKYLKKSDRAILPTDRLLDLLPTMPFDDVNDFLDFDESLASNENVQDQFLIKLRRLLVSNEQKSISNIMASILTNELCRRISWTGIKNTVTFGSSNMVNLIIDLVQQYHELDIDVIKSRIAEWLRRCGDRISNEIRKNNKKKIEFV